MQRRSRDHSDDLGLRGAMGDIQQWRLPGRSVPHLRRRAQSLAEIRFRLLVSDEMGWRVSRVAYADASQGAPVPSDQAVVHQRSHHPAVPQIYVVKYTSPLQVHHLWLRLFVLRHLSGMAAHCGELFPGGLEQWVAVLFPPDLGANSVPVPIDQYYLPSWNVTIVCLILFVGISNLAYIILRYRLKLPGASQMAFDQIKWIRESAVLVDEPESPTPA
jgi:hypothetical protein